MILIGRGGMAQDAISSFNLKHIVRGQINNYPLQDFPYNNRILICGWDKTVIWETIAHILVAIPTVIYALILISSVLGFIALIVLMVIRTIKDKTNIVPKILGIVFIALLVFIGLIFGDW